MEPYPYPKAVKIFTPIGRDIPDGDVDELEDYADTFNVAILWAIGCDAAILFGSETDVMEVLRYAQETYPNVFRGEPAEA